MTPRKLTKPEYSFTESDARKAFDDWGCNCGPTALATMTGLSLDDVHPHIPDFDDLHYTNPTMMKAALAGIGVQWGDRKSDGSPIDQLPHLLTRYGLCRIQWEGPWYGRFAYRKTHWIGAMEYRGMPYVFDCNSGWVSQGIWEKDVVPTLTEMYKRATGAWHCTHRWELWP